MKEKNETACVSDTVTQLFIHYVSNVFKNDCQDKLLIIQVHAVQKCLFVKKKQPILIYINGDSYRDIIIFRSAF